MWPCISSVLERADSGSIPRDTGIISWLQKWLERPSIRLASQTLPFWTSTSGAKPPAKREPRISNRGNSRICWHYNGEGKAWVPNSKYHIGAQSHSELSPQLLSTCDVFRPIPHTFSSYAVYCQEWAFCFPRNRKFLWFCLQGCITSQFKKQKTRRQ